MVNHPRGSARRLRLLRTDIKQYLAELDHTDIDMLLSSLAKANGLSEQEIEEHVASLREAEEERLRILLEERAITDTPRGIYVKYE